MKDKLKDRLAAALMGELLVQLARRDRIKTLLGEIEASESDDFIDGLLDEFERILSRKVSDRPGNAGQEGVPSPEHQEEPAPAPEASAPRAADVPTLFPADAVEEVQPGSVSTDDGRIASAGADAAEPAADNQTSAEEQRILTYVSDLFRKELEGAKIWSDEQSPASNEVVPPGTDTPISEHVEDQTIPPAQEEKESAPATPVVPEVSGPPDQPVVSTPASPSRTPCLIEEDAYLYVHGIAFLPDAESASSGAFLLEQKGIEGRDPAIAFEQDGLRVYLSTFHARSMNVSKTGTLLLSKSESIQMLQVHARVLNDLRTLGTILPCAFGTVARGKADLLEKIVTNLPEILAALDELESTTWWNLSAFALDASIGGRGSGSGRTRGEHNRGRSGYSSASTVGRFDIKTLEKILGKQKKVAESIHSEISAAASRSDIDMIISLGSGSSDDWKLILKASYEVLPAERMKFYKALATLQHRHSLADLMFSLTGDREQIALH